MKSTTRAAAFATLSAAAAIAAVVYVAGTIESRGLRFQSEQTKAPWAVDDAPVAKGLMQAPTSGIHICGVNLCNGATVISAPLGTRPPGFPQPHVHGEWAEALHTQRIAYLADTGEINRYTGYGVDASGGPVERITRPLPHDYTVSDIDLSPDGQWAIYRSGISVPGTNFELWSASSFGGASVRLSIPGIGRVERDFAASCDSRFVRFVYFTGQIFLPSVSPIGGGEMTSEQPAAWVPDCGLFNDGFEGGTATGWSAP